jgi:hypothetical protein
MEQTQENWAPQCEPATTEDLDKENSFESTKMKIDINCHYNVDFKEDMAASACA